MDDQEKLMTKMVRVLLENAVITFVGAGIGGLTLGPIGFALVGSVSSGIHLLASEGITTWSQLRAAKNWVQLVALTLQVALKLAIEHSGTLYELACFIIKFLERIYNNNHNHNHNVPLSY